MGSLTLLLAACSSPTPGTTDDSLGPAISRNAQELEDALNTFAGSHSGASVINDGQLRSTIPQAQQWLEDVEVNPSKCGITFAAPISEQLQNSVMGAVQLGDQLITVAVYPDSATLKSHWDTQASASTDCSRYSVKVDGESRAYHLAKQPVQSNAKLTEGYVVTESDGNKTSQQLIVRAATANILLGIQQETSGSTTATQLASATETVNQLIDQLD
ncbi:hypothetical protein [Glutamicibacter sp. NPDC087344]|uniref:hypothetical protein n=1 Tax=Glutamicibacter sp. NPDC087344 TaxID=3363994 RepID=UPI003813DB2A